MKWNTAIISKWNTAEISKWNSTVEGEGLGMGMFCADSSYLDGLIANGFTDLRIDIPDYDDSGWVASSKTTVGLAVGKGARVIWGVKPSGTITSSNWGTFVTACKSEAAWAQANGVYEFQIGNEGEGQVDGDTMTVYQFIAAVKALATEVQAIFTNGNVSYSCHHEYIKESISPWRTGWWVDSGGKGDLDILNANVYMTWGTTPPGGNSIEWEDEIDALVTAFGVDGTNLTEFNINTSGMQYYSETESVQAAAITTMADYIKTAGIKKAFFFVLKSDNHGVYEADDTQRELIWAALLAAQ